MLDHRRLLALLAAAVLATGSAGASSEPVAAGGGAGIGTPGPILFVRDEPGLGGPFPQRLWTLAPGGTPVVIPNTVGASDGRWAPDGRVIAFNTWDSGIFLVNPDGSGLRPLFTPAEGEHFGTPYWSADGRRLAFWAHTNGANMHLEIADSLDGAREILPTDLSYVTDWAADGSFWGDVIRNWQDPQTGDYHHSEDLAVMTSDGATRELTSTPSVHEGVPRLSPDGTKVAFASCVDVSLGYKIEVMNVDGTGRRVLATVQNASWPTWSPDGTRILYVDGYTPMLVSLATGAKTVLIENLADAREGFDWAPLPDTVTPPVTQPTTSAAGPELESVTVEVDGGIRGLALPDPSTVATSTVSATTIWPYRDGYRDTIKVNLRMKEPARSRVDIYNRAGTRVKAVTFPWRTGLFSWRWTGRNAAGSILPSGRYRVVTSATDLAGNVLRKTFYVTLYRGRP